MSTPESTSNDLTPLERELRKFIASELTAADGAEAITADEDLVKRGIVDSLGVTQLVQFCESQYGIRVTDADLVPANFRSVRGLANYIERKGGERVRKRGLLSRIR